MPTSSFDENHEFDMAVFDGYSRSVLKNSCVDAKKEIHKRKDNEISSTELMQYINETAGQEDMYPSEFVISDKHGYNCVVTLEWLYQAILLLPKKQREVLILEFWRGLSRKEVAAKLMCPNKQSVFGSVKHLIQFAIITKGKK